MLFCNGDVTLSLVTGAGILFFLIGGGLFGRYRDERYLAEGLNGEFYVIEIVGLVLTILGCAFLLVALILFSRKSILHKRKKNDERKKRIKFAKENMITFDSQFLQKRGSDNPSFIDHNNEPIVTIQTSSDQTKKDSVLLNGEPSKFSPLPEIEGPQKGYVPTHSIELHKLQNVKHDNEQFQFSEIITEKL